MANAPQNQGSVSRLIHSLKAGDDGAANDLCGRYFLQLCNIAKRKLGNHPQGMSDEEDIALSVFHSLCAGAKASQFRKLEDRSDLWSLLVVITTNKVTDRIRHDNAIKRGGARTPDSIEDAVADSPLPEDLIALKETCELLLEKLKDETLQRVAKLRLEGFSKRDVAIQLQVSKRTVDRKLELIKAIWDAVANS